MKYIEEKDLKTDQYYICETYSGEYIVVLYYGNGLFSTDLSFNHIRYVFKEHENLESFINEKN